MRPAHVVLALILCAVPTWAGPVDADELLVFGVRGKDEALSTWLLDGTGLRRAGSGVAVLRPSGWIRLERVQRRSATTDDTRLVPVKPGQKPALPPPDVQEGCQVVKVERLLFAGPEFYSFEKATSGDCEAAAQGLSTVLLRSAAYDEGSRADPREIGALLGPSIAAAFRTDAERAHGGQEKRQLDCLADAEPADFGVIRGRGRWGLYGELNYAADVCKPKREYFEVELDLPERATGHDKLAVPFVRLAEQHEGLADALASPSGRTLLLVRADGLEGLAGDKSVGKEPLDEPAIVAAHWASGKTAAKWRAEVARALGK
jgi:hypothetical protein